MPRYPEKRPTGGVHAKRAFSLVLSLTVMAMLLILCVGAAALLSMELRVAQASVLMTRARLNALYGSRIALGELQRLVGPDQRVTATADILGNPDQTDPTQAASYASPTNGTVVHPRWVGVWNAAATDDTSNPGAVAGQTKRLLYRAEDGSLRDARYATNEEGSNGRDAWTTRRAGSTMNNSSKRLLCWLVSGSEALARNDATSPTPYTAYDANKDIVALGRGTLGSLFNENQTASDMLGARVRIVPIPNLADTAAAASTLTDSSYAYWISDEGVKARFNIRDKYQAAGIRPNGGRPGDGGLARFLLSQSGHVDTTSVRSPIGGAPALPNIDYADNGKAWDKTKSFDDLALADNPSSPASSPYRPELYRPYYFHDFTFDSAGVQTDTENGGLKKDLTAFLLYGGTQGIADYSGVAASGVAMGRSMLPAQDSATGAPEAKLKAVIPTFAVLSDWWKNAPMYVGSTQANASQAVGPLTTNVNYVQVTNMHGASVAQAVPATTVVRTPDMLFGATSKAPLAPIVTQMTVYFKPILDDVAGTTTAPKTRCLMYPQIVLWNPYPVAIRLNAPVVQYLNNWAVWANITGDGSGSVSYVAMHPLLNYTLPATVIRPGQSISFVVDTGNGNNNLPRGQGVAPTNPQYGYNVRRNIVMKQGLPTSSTFYVDGLIGGGGWDTSMTFAAGYPAIAGVSMGYCNSIFSPSLFDEKTLAAEQLILMDGATTLSHVKLDSNNTRDLPTGDRHFPLKPLEAPWTQAVVLGMLSQELASPTGANPSMFYGFRLKRLDNSESTITGAGGNSARGLRTNPIVDMNVRAARQTRNPFDAQDMICPPSTRSFRTNVTLTFNYGGQYSGGIWTQDYSASQTLNGLGVSAADKVVPLFRSSSAAGAQNYPGCILFDVPYTDVGLLSLAQLASAPLNEMSFGPAMPFASGRIPTGIYDAGRPATALTNRTAFNQNENLTAWSNIAAWGQNGVEAFRQLSRIGNNSLDIVDVAYELNHGLWDTYTFSGIPRENPGWQIATGGWSDDAPAGTNSVRTLPSSRYENAGTFPTNTGFFASDTYKLYHAPYTLLNEGAFNVNSTSRVAWISLLTSCRGLNVPTIEGDVATTGRTPFLRLLRPKTGMVNGGAFTEKTWAGFRALNDAEIQLLADKIVAEVKKRGPFMSLSDFVNRRLKTPSADDYTNWTQRECDYLGTIEAAILTARINDSMKDEAPTPRQPADVDNFVNVAAMVRQSQNKPQHRSESLVAGSPGYLQQSDILRSVGNALTARSDTFTIRARGECEGAVAWVEVTVQRYPEPLIPGSGLTLPVNPKSVTGASEYAGNQLFGRRMRIVATRWVDAQAI